MAGQDEVSARALLDDLEQRLARGPHVALGIPASASLPEIRLAFLELAKTYHPTKFARQDPEIQRQATEVFLALRGAYEGLGKEARRQSQPAMPARQPRPNAPARSPTPVGGIPAMPPPRMTPPPQAQPVPITPARGTSVPTRPPYANNGGARAAAGKPEDPLAAILDQVQKGHWEAARSALHILTAKNPTVPRYHAMLAYVRGREAQLARRLDEARVEFMHALQLDPDLDLAKTALGELFTRRK